MSKSITYFIRPMVLFLLLGTVILFQSCDAFRSLAGRPTSEEIAQKKEIILRGKALEKQRLDSLAAVKKAKADSTAAADSIAVKKINLIAPAALGGIAGEGIDFKYCVVIGAFGSETNVKSALRKAEDAGYKTAVIPFKRGLSAVGVCPTDILAEVYNAYVQLRTEPFCPAEAWILVNE